MSDNTELAARRLSAALGRKIAPEDVAEVVGDTTVFVHDPDSVWGTKGYRLLGGNAAYSGGDYWRNGKPWHNVHDEGQDPRWD